MTDYNHLVKASVLTQPVYEPGKPIEIVAAEHGLDPATIIKLASNENPLGCSPLALEAATQALGHCHLYPESSAASLRAKLATMRGLSADSFIVGRGSSEIIDLLCAAFVAPGIEVVMGSIAFASYKIGTLLHGGTPVEVPMRKDYAHDLDAMRGAITPATRLVFLTSPNNPTGVANATADILAFARSLPDHVVLCIDGAYEEYLDETPDFAPLVREGRRVLWARTFSKAYGLAGHRVGYGMANPALIRLLERIKPVFNVTIPALAAAEAALDDQGFVAHSRFINGMGRDQLCSGCHELGLEVVPGNANFIMVRVGDGPGLFARLQARGMIVRPLAGYGMREWLRVTIGTPEQNSRFVELLGGLLKARS